MHVKNSLANATRRFFLGSILRQSSNYLPLTGREKTMIKWFLKFCFSVIFVLGSWFTPILAVSRHFEEVRELKAQVIEKEIEKAPEGQNEANSVLPVARAEEYSTVTAVITAYSEYDSCHTGASCLMASGKKAYVGAIACPRNIRLGTRVIIDNNPYVCEDRVSLKYPERFDIFMGYGQDAYNKALSYGKQTKKVSLEQGVDY
jgi:3D (Asp-Asp-Asp) domain-containing protein